jgi:hypothetical protein
LMVSQTQRAKDLGIIIGPVLGHKAPFTYSYDF